MILKAYIYKGTLHAVDTPEGMMEYIHPLRFNISSQRTSSLLSIYSYYLFSFSSKVSLFLFFKFKD